MVLLAKSADTADITNLRPIGLEDCLRKLWFGIVYKRIAEAWKEFEALDMAHHGFVPNRETDIQWHTGPSQSIGEGAGVGGASPALLVGRQASI